MASQDTKKNFEEKLIDTISKDLSNNTIDLYIGQLRRLSGKKDKPINNLSFLNKTDDIITKITTDYKLNTQKSYLTGICSVLNSYSKKNKAYVELYNFYKKTLYEMVTNPDNVKDPHYKTDTQNENWIEWNEVLSVRDTLADKVEGIESCNEITNGSYDNLLNYIIISLYTDIEPRRNADYQLLYLVNNDSADLPTDKNYFDISNHNFVFNQYKNVKQEGKKTLPCPDELYNKIMTKYCRFHPLIKNNLSIISNDNPIPLLVYYNGEPLKQINSMTRILNKIFDKNIGASMLRNIYLTHKYKDTIKIVDDMKQSAYNMSHTLYTQQGYIKTD